MTWLIRILSFLLLVKGSSSERVLKVAEQKREKNVSKRETAVM